MTTLSVAILGLGRTGASVGLALQRYMTKGGKYKFERVGYDPSPDVVKQAVKMQAIDESANSPYAAVANKDLVVMALSYDEVKRTYRDIAGDLRAGVVILDASPIKRPSLDWAAEYFDDEKHIVGITPIVNPRYLMSPGESIDAAEEDLFDQSTIIITPSASCIKEAVDLAFNFCTILGSKPRFLDPLEHDTLLAFTEGIPSLVGVALFQHLMRNGSWDDMKWFTNPNFGVLTRPLMDTHPDALRDVWTQNSDVMVRALDTMIQTLQQYRDVLKEGDTAAIEAVLESAAREYEDWINHRYKADWDDVGDPDVRPSGTFMGTLFGEKFAKRLSGRNDD